MRPVLTDVLHRRACGLAVACAASGGHQVCEVLVPLAVGLAVDHAVHGGPPAVILLAVVAVMALFAVLATGGATSFRQAAAATAVDARQLRVRVAAGYSPIREPARGHGPATWPTCSSATPRRPRSSCERS